MKRGNSHLGDISYVGINVMEEELKELLSFIEFHPSIEVEEVHRSAQRALALSKQLGNKAGKIVSLWAIALHKNSKGRYDEAESLLKKALDLADDSKSLHLKGRVLSTLGGTYFQTNQVRKSLDYLFEALKFIDPFWEGAPYNTLGLIYRGEKKYQISDQYLQQAIHKGRRNKNYALQVSSLLNFARNKVLQSQFEDALQICREAIELSKKYNFLRGQVYGLNHLVNIYTQIHKYNEALELCEELIEATKRENLIAEYTKALELKAMLCFKLNREPEGLRVLHQALDLAIDNDHDQLSLLILDELCRYYEDKNEHQKALVYARKANQIYKNEQEGREKSDIQQKLFDQEEQIFLLKKQQDKIAQQNKELRQYAYIVAHDLKEPLRNVSGFASLLTRRYKHQLEEEAQEYLGFIKDGVQRMHHQLTDLLTYATLDEPSDETETVDLNEIIGEVLTLLQPKIQETNARINYPAMPVFRGLRAHFIQLFQNLLQNALKFRSPDTAPIIEISFSENDTFYTISIKDNGIGIDPKFHDVIFMIFKRLDRHSYEGTGIGLALCQKVIELYDGEIWVESELGKGANFLFTINKKKVF